MSVTLNVTGLQMTLIALRHSTVALRDAARPAITAAGEAYHAQVRKAVSLRDHTLADLAALDHPYARRHGKIRIHTRKPWQVHRQSGRALNALRGRPIQTSGSPGYEVTYDYVAAPHMRYVILGTKVMLPRDVLWEVALRDDTKKAMMKRVVRVLGKELKSKLGVRFGTGRPGGTSLGVR